VDRHREKNVRVKTGTHTINFLVPTSFHIYILLSIYLWYVYTYTVIDNHIRHCTTHICIMSSQKKECCYVSHVASAQHRCRPATFVDTKRRSIARRQQLRPFRLRWGPPSWPPWPSVWALATWKISVTLWGSNMVLENHYVEYLRQLICKWTIFRRYVTFPGGICFILYTMIINVASPNNRLWKPWPI